MKLLADENIESKIVDWFRSIGHDVFWAAESAVSISDDVLLRLAAEEQRVVITHDLDFGEMLFRQRLGLLWVILLRSRAALQEQQLTILERFWPVIETRVFGHFTVVTDRNIRIRPLLRD